MKFTKTILNFILIVMSFFLSVNWISNESIKIFLIGDSTLFSEGKQDNTHFSIYGAKKIASLVVEGIKEIGLPFIESLKEPVVYNKNETSKNISFLEDKKLIITVNNTIALFRSYETISINWDKIRTELPGINDKNLEVIDVKLKRPILNQLLDDDSDGKINSLLFQIDIAPNEQKTFWICINKESNTVINSNIKTFGMFVPQRKDDFAWENDRIAFRMYGPALQQSGEISSGVDVWVKRVRYPVIEKWYKNDNYHEDHGEGVDFYKVGPSRGCGGMGIFKNGNLFVSKNYIKWKLIANGPIRTIFELDYAPWDLDGNTVQERKRISLDLGSNMNKFESRVELLNKNSIDESLAVGIVKRENDGDVSYNLKEGWLTYWQPKDSVNGSIGCAIIIPEIKLKILDTLGHIMMITECKKYEPNIYYAGAGWDKSGDFTNSNDWDIYIKNYALRLSNPLKINMTK